MPTLITDDFSDLVRLVQEREALQRKIRQNQREINRIALRGIKKAQQP